MSKKKLRMVMILATTVLILMMVLAYVTPALTK